MHSSETIKVVLARYPLRVVGALVALLVLAVVRAMSRNCQKRYEENMKFERAFGGIGRKFSFWKRKFADRKTHVYIKCGVCKKTLRLPKVKGEHTVKCPNCANKFKVKI